MVARFSDESAGPARAAVAGALAALAAASPWVAADALRVLAGVEAAAPVRLALFAFALAAVAVIPGGALLGAVVGILGRDVGMARAIAAFVAFVAGGLVAVGVPANQNWLPARGHPVSLAADALLLGVLVLAARALARRVRGPGGARLLAGTLAASLVATLGLAAILGPRTTPVARRGAEPPGAPNVLVVVIDSLRAAEADGTEVVPAVVGLGAEGATFTRAYSASSWTKPSVATLLTGLDPAAHGAVRHRDVLAQELTTLPETFAARGYRTAVFSANPWVSPTFGFAQGVEHFVESDPGGEVTRLMAGVRVVQLVARAVPALPVAAGLQALRTGLGVDTEGRTNCARDDELTVAIGDWLRRAEAPFFAYVHYMGAHLPYEAPGPRRVERAAQLAMSRGDLPLAADALRAEYLAALRHTDGQLAALLRLLDERGLADRTLVVVTADHGEELGEHGQLGHGKNLYHETVEVPLVLRFPGRVAPGTRVDALMGSRGLPALVLALLDAPAAGGDAAVRDARTVGPVRLALDLDGGASSASLVSAAFQYIETTAHLGAEPRRELFDLRRDPGEQVNVWSPESRRGRRFAARLQSFARAAARAPAPQAVVGSETSARLRTLGYIR
jgi:arylsulfatase A-like enzyme